ncbi:MAG: diguanylate cyclase [Lachnospiraceae bacterium]|nr:diguanylate cyclase [Lachnospiraceae bacterium]
MDGHHVFELTEKIWKDLGKKRENYIYISHYNSFDMNSEIVKAVQKKWKRTSFYFYEFRGSRMSVAYAPFFDWIQERCNEENLSYEDLMEICQIYPMHRDVLLSYFKTGKAKRTDEVIIGEVRNEEEEMLTSIVRMIGYFAEKKPIIFILHKLHVAGSSALKVILRLIKKSTKNIGMLLTYNDYYSPMEYCEKILKELNQICTVKDKLIDWRGDEVLEAETTTFHFHLHHMDSYMKKISNMIETLAMEQARYYLSILYHKFEVEELSVTPAKKFKILESYARVCVYQGDIANALLICDAMKKIADQVSDNDSNKIYYMYLYYMIMTFVEIYNDQSKLAQKTARECQKLGEGLQDDFLLFRAELLEHMSRYNGWENIWLCEDGGEELEKLVEKCKKYGYYNHLAHIYVYAYDNNKDLYYKVEGLEARLKYQKKGWKIAEQLENKHFLIAAYRKALMIASSNGYFDVSDYFYIFKEKPVIRMTFDLFEEGNMYNGLGYNCCAREMHEQAHEFFCKGLMIFYQLESYEYISETLYNMSINAILAGDYVNADKFVSYCMKLLTVLKKDSMRVCHISKLYGLKALCSYRLNVMYNCKSNVKNAQQFLDYIIHGEAKNKMYYYWDDDVFLYFFNRGLILMSEGKYEDAMENFISAELPVERSTGGAFFNYVQFCVEKAKCHGLLGEEKKAMAVLQQALEYCDEKKYEKQKEIVLYAMKHMKYHIESVDLPVVSVDLDELIASAHIFAMKKELEETRENLGFLTIWQKMVNAQNHDVDNLIESSILNFKNSFYVDHMLFLRYEGGKPVIRYNDTECALEEERLIQKIVRYFEKNKSSFVTTKLDKNYYGYNDIISIFDRNKICTFMAVPLFVNEKLDSIFISYVMMKDNWYTQTNKFVLANISLDYFEFLFRHFLDAIEHLEDKSKVEKMNRKLSRMNERLKNIAVSDRLTGLYNRQGFAEKIEELSEQLDEKEQIAIFYADLDNFKYYNDNYGHDIGDLILVKFSNILKELASEQGFAVRYGGDEFVMILRSGEKEKIRATAECIYESIRNCNYFLDDISVKIGEKVTVDPDYYVSCSVGIATVGAIDMKDGIDETMKKADETLYYIKRTCKHRFELWDDVRDLI